MMQQTNQKNCYCGSTQPFEQCCQPLLLGTTTAKTAEQLMRSRYSAYACKSIDYIYDTYASVARNNISRDDIADWANQAHWLKLDIIQSQQQQHSAIVEFKAYFQVGLQTDVLHEVSRFVKENGEWRYLDGDIK
jgi:SEC-C motif-containing protein